MNTLQIALQNRMRNYLFVLVLATLLGYISSYGDKLKDGWDTLDSFAPQQTVVDIVKKKGSDWSISPVTSGTGPQNRDYYSIKINYFPPGWSPDNILDNYFEWLSNASRPSNSGIFGVTFAADSSGPRAIGKLYRLNFLPLDIVACSDLPTCTGSWWVTKKLCAALDVAYKGWCPLGGKKGWVVVSESSPREVRLTTLIAGTGLAADGRHPVAGTREFGVTPNTTGGYVLYTMASDRSGLPDLPNVAVTYGVFAVGDIFWRRFNSEFVDYINSRGGSAEIGKTYQSIIGALPDTQGGPQTAPANAMISVIAQ